MGCFISESSHPHEDADRPLLHQPTHKDLAGDPPLQSLVSSTHVATLRVGLEEFLES